MSENRPSQGSGPDGGSRKGRKPHPNPRPELVAPGAPGNTRSPYWAIRERIAGRAVYTSTRCQDEAGAQAFLQTYLNERAKPAKAITVNQVLDKHLDHMRAKKKAQVLRAPEAMRSRLEAGAAKLVKARISGLRLLRERFGELDPDEIEPGSIDDYITDRRHDGVSDRTISLELAYFRAAMMRAKRKKWIASVPDMELPQEQARARNRVISMAEFVRLREALKDSPLHLKGFILISAYTGQRGVHVRALRWEHVDFEAGWIYFTRSNPLAAENKKCADMPMAPPVRRALVELREAALTDWVIEWNGKPVQSVRKAWESVCRRSGLENVNIHDMRRTFATLAKVANATLQDTADVMNLDAKTLRRHYAHAHSQALIEGIRGLDDED